MTEVGSPRVVTMKVTALLGIVAALLLLSAGQARAGWTSPFEIASDVTGGNVKVAVDEAGNANVLWTTQDDFSSPYEMKFARVPAGGIPETGAATTLNEPGAEGSYDADIDVNADGRAVATYVQGPLGNNRPAVAVIPAGGEPGPAEEIPLPDDFYISVPRVAVAPNGQALAVFQLSSPEADQSVAGALIAEDGTLGDLIDISQIDNDDQGFTPDVDVDDSGEFKVVWARTHVDSGDPITAEMATVQSDGDVSEPIVVSPGTASVFGPRISTEADGDAAITWSGESGAGVFLARVSAGGTVGETVQVNSPGITGDPRINVADDGTVTIMYFAIGGGGIGPYFVRVPAGSAPETAQVVSPGTASYNADFDGNSRGDALAVLAVDSPPDGSIIQARYIPPTGEVPDPVALTKPGPGQPIAAAVGDGGDLFAAFGAGASGTRLSGSRLAGVLATGIPPDFGNVEVGSSVNRQIVLRNEGGSLLDLGAIGVSGAAASDYTVEAGACPELKLQQDSSCVISVQFKPSVAGPRAAELTIESDGIRTSSPVALNGTGVAGPTPPGKAKVRITRVAPKRANVRRGKSKTVKVTVKNAGNAAAEGVRVCSRLNATGKKKVRVRGCASLGRMSAGATETASLKVTAKRGSQAKGKARIGLRLTSKNAGGGSAAAVFGIRR